jgi:bifunctional non-homologous end joining protein LigD
MINDLAGLISLVQIGVLEFHPWPAIEENLESPDRMIFDLDPGPDVSWKDVIAAAHDVRAELDARGLQSFVRTSGGKGLHVVVPLAPQHSWDDVKEFAHDVSVTLVDHQPNRYVATMAKSKRGGKVFIDYFRNGRGATAVASYSTRARVGAPVALPIRWEDLSRTTAADQFNVVNTLRRLKSRKQDPWKGFLLLRQSLT